MKSASLIFSLDMGECDCYMWLLHVLKFTVYMMLSWWWWHMLYPVRYHQAAGHSWGRLEEARPCHCRLQGACGQEWLLTSSCTPSALCMSSLARTETTMYRSYGRTSCQVETNHLTLCNCIHKVCIQSFSPYEFVFWQIISITSGSRWQTTSIVHMTTALSCIMEGELLFEAT